MAVPFAKLKESAALSKALKKAGVISTDMEGLSQFAGGPSLNHISLEYLLSSTCLPLGIIMQLFGPEGSGKTTMALHLLNEYFLRPGGDAHLIDTEKKISNKLFRGVIDPEAAEDGRFTIDRADYLEDAQTLLTLYTKEIGKLTHGKQRDDAPHLLGLALDSFRVASRATAEKITSEGYASKQFAQEANLWRMYLNAHMAKMLNTPVTLFIVNHQVEKESGTGYGKVYDVGGGVAIKFYETYRIQVKPIGGKSTNSEVYNDIALTTFKNSNGEGKQRIYPSIVFKRPDLPEGRVLVDFDIADAKLLTGSDVPRSELKAEGICNVTASSKTGLYNDDVNNIKMAPITDITQNLYESPDKLEALRKKLEITKLKTLEELYEEGWFKDARGAVSGDDD